MRRLFVSILLLALCFGAPQAVADACQDAIDEHNEWNDEMKSWVDGALQAEFGTSELASLDRSDPGVCRRLLPIQQEHLSRAEELVALRDTAYQLCERVRETGNRGTAQELADAIQQRIQDCEEQIAGSESEESEEEFKAAQQQAEQQQQQAAQRTSPPPGSSTSGYARSANCSDITGTGGGGSAADCPEPKKREFAAAPPPGNPARTPSSSPPSSGTKPSVIDQLTGLMGSIVDALGRSGQEDGKQKSSTGASLPEDFDPRTFDSYRNDPPELPQEGMLCRQYFLRMLDAFHQNAKLCIRDTRLLQSITEMVQKEIQDITEDDRLVTRKTPPKLYAYFAENDPRWQNMGDYFEPRCEMPMTVSTQEESFKECARVYLCGARAAQCGLKRSRGTKTKDCRPISEACLAENPIPQYMRSDPSPPAYQPPNWQQPQPKGMPQSKSTITGPSGPGGGGGSGGVIPAR